MFSVQVTDYAALVAFWLAFTRWITILLQLPIFDNLTVPSMVKVLTAILLTYAFYPYVSAQIMLDINYIGLDNFWALTAFYALIGVLIGFIVRSIMFTFIAAGSIITQQIGFAAVSYFDPSSAQQVGPFEKILQWTILVMILTTGATLPMFKGIFSSFFTIHIYDLGKLVSSPEFYLEFFKSIFLSALLLATPLIFANIFIMSVLGIIARMVPQMNIIMISFVLNIGVGLLVFAASSDEFFQVAYKIYTDKLGEWFHLVI
jgi:flagellar biosynthesis protein FliR